MNYDFVDDPSEIAKAFAKFRRALGVTEVKVRRNHKDHGFWARGEEPYDSTNSTKGTRDIVVLGRIEYEKDQTRISVRPKNPTGVAGLVVIDDERRLHLAHSGVFDERVAENLLRKNTKDNEWIDVRKDKQRYLITALDDIDDGDLLRNVARFVHKRYTPGYSKGRAMTNDKALKAESARLNRILCGPPGTSKTYDSISMAVEVIDGHGKRERKELTDRFKDLKKEGRVEFVTFHQNYAYEDFIEGIRPLLKAEGDAGVHGEDDSTGRELHYVLRDGIFKKIAKQARKDPSNRYVLIIDEINRGNIAKIFGELITLIEPSKRTKEGAVEAAEVMLPYSQKPFSVPANLYLIGTMNTADRSIALLDVALRRRFNFVERMPNPDHESIEKNIEGVDGRCLLKAINRRIVEKLDRERQIGHTFLIDVQTLDELKRVFQNQIIPLLQEYFYDDYEKMRAVLNNNAFITRHEGADRPVFDVLAPDHSSWLKAKEYLNIYSTNSGTDGE